MRSGAETKMWTEPSRLRAASIWAGEPGEVSCAQPVINRLVASSILHPEDWLNLSDAERDAIEQLPTDQAILAQLVEHGLLTEYQTDRVRGGNTFGLVLGNYRVLERLSIGGMGVVFKSEHIHMRRVVAIKAVSVCGNQNPIVVRRFRAEARAIAQLKHPNIVAALDSGEVENPDPGAPGLQYLVMEYVPGYDLEEYVQAYGPLEPAKACDLAYQIAAALDEAHKHHVVHRDVKPSNVRIMADGHAKLVDFGLVLRFGSRMTEPGLLLGTMDYIAPEQARDASAVDIRADLYGLGGTLFWCLTGRTPFPGGSNIAGMLLSRWTQAPPSVRAWRPEVPGELDAIISRLMAIDPDDRFPDPQTVMRALHTFLQSQAADPTTPQACNPAQLRALEDCAESFGRVQRVLVVDDEAPIRLLCRYALQSEELHCDEAGNGVLALQAIHAQRYDLVLLDIDMPEMRGTEVLRRLRQAPPVPHLKILMFSGRASADEMADMLLAGADDYLTKPFSTVQLAARVKASLRLKMLQEQADVQKRQLLAAHSEQGQVLTSRESELIHTRNALVLALSRLVQYRKNDTSARLLRLRRYCRCLAEVAAGEQAFAGQIDPAFIRTLDHSVPLYDLGTVVLPDHILHSPGKLDLDDSLILQSHTTIGAEILGEIAREHGPAVAFLQMAVDVARHHHERWDGTGYPDGLAGPAIPLAARIVALADAYDALRSRQPSKPPLAHASALRVMTEGSAGQFDPELVQVFRQCASQFERIFRDQPG
jgi:response regulator RpfG family c-di-GMP phosphodiesterase/serine/threonine protein kinase